MVLTILQMYMSAQGGGATAADDASAPEALFQLLLGAQLRGK
jgi:hypothetical protein